ncbi:hypothetical protein [Hydrogenophaga sp. PML113]|uniref:hypothetical protein n=1 Tax=Hydrogenophaga sp. PML113 TaxID=1899350 RepID=UPI0011131B2E|nr:hypothetical protein [Hydrogenophaga sp. PML113]
MLALIDTDRRGLLRAASRRRGDEDDVSFVALYVLEILHEEWPTRLLVHLEVLRHSFVATNLHVKDVFDKLPLRLIQCDDAQGLLG